MSQGEDREEQPESIEVEVQSKHYRPMSSQWLANGVVMVDGRPVYWKAARQYAKWEIEPSAEDGWEITGDARQGAVEMIVRALQENRRFLSRQAEREVEREAAPEGGPRITLAHGGGGTLMHELIRKVIVKKLSSPELKKLDDGALLPKPAGRLVMTTDTFVVNPLFFKGGDIGSLAVCGTVNNLSVSGAKPLVVSLGLVLEEGLPLSTLSKILASVKKAASRAGVRVVTGDTRVVEKGKVDKVFINTTGLGAAFPRLRASLDRAKPGDAVIVSGSLGDHGVAVICEREGLQFEGAPQSDVAPVNSLVAKLLEAKVSVRCMKDPTRGGAAAALNQIASRSGVAIELDESALPVGGEVKEFCEIMGLDPLYVANQGKVIVVCSKRTAKKALETMKRHRLGRKAAIIGRVTAGVPGRVILRGAAGTSRIVDMPYGEGHARVF